MDTLPRRRRILVVDDEADVRALLLATLEDAGYDVDLAEDGVSALGRILAHRPDLVTLDLSMPGMDGWELAAKLGALPAPPPIVVISGAEGSPGMLGSLQPLVRACLSKPFPAGFLLQTCARVLDAVERARACVVVERRKSVRRPVAIDVTLLSAEGVPLVRGHVLDLSVDGAHLDLGIPLAQDSRPVARRRHHGGTVRGPLGGGRREAHEAAGLSGQAFSPPPCENAWISATSAVECCAGFGEANCRYPGSSGARRSRMQWPPGWPRPPGGLISQLSRERDIANEE
jgi:CheY-like chemotaxis protein